jgi:ankyrin repeat protein
MGAGASVSENTEEKAPIKTYGLKQLPDAIEEAIFVKEKFPLILDPTEQASRFLKYQGTFILADLDHSAMTKEALNRALVGALQYGRTLTLKYPTLEGVDQSIFTEGFFPKEVLNRESLYNPDVWKSLLKPDLGDPDPDEFYPAQEFVFIILTNTDFVPLELQENMHTFKCDDTSKKEGPQNSGSGDGVLDAVATLYGAAEIVRNSPQLVEAAFDGDMDELKSWIDKGFHIESTDGRKHTGLSEAASQGHMDVVKFFLEQGANPNNVSDTGRSALWRAAFNGHTEVVKLLLESGSDPDAVDKVSHEAAFDVCENAETRQVLQEWDRGRTEKLIEKRRREMLAAMEERIKTAVEREAYAKQQLRLELVQKAEAGDVDGIKILLEMTAEEADKTGQRPRANAEARNNLGQSLLSIAAQRDDEVLVEFLLTHWKKIDEDRWDLAEGEVSIEGKTFKVNPNSRDLKGWTCVCIAVFHDSRKCLKLLLEAGGDPNIKSSYNKNAWDLAKDELDAAEQVVTSRAEIRQVLIDYDTTTKRNAIFGTSNAQEGEVNPNKAGTEMYNELGPDGSPIVMQIEMSEGGAVGAEKKKKKSGGASTKKSGGTSAGGKGKGKAKK